MRMFQQAEKTSRSRSRAWIFCSLSISLTLGFISLAQTPAKGQTSAAVPKSGPGTPLPKISLDFLKGSIIYEPDENGLTRVIASGGVTLLYGDLRIQADTVTYTPDGVFVEATGSVLVTRGDESLRGDHFVFRTREGTSEAAHTVIISPPFYVSADRFIQGKNGSLLQNARVTPSPDGKGEISLSAREIQLTADGKNAVLRDMTIRLLGTRLLTVRHARIPIGARRTQERDKNGLSLPVTLRVSGISGVTPGIALPFTIDSKTSGNYGLEFPQRNSMQYFAQVRRDLISGESLSRERSESSFFAMPGGMGSPQYAGLSPIRQIAIARPLPLPPDSILDYDSILSSSDPVERPLRALYRNLFVQANVSANRDISSKRQGPLLLSRIPEIQVSGSFPLIGKIPQNASDADLRRFLQSPHLQVTGDFSTGKYREQQLREGGDTVRSARTGVSVGVGLLPLLIGNHLLLRPQITSNRFKYDAAGSPTYHYLESNFTLDYLFYGRTMLGGSYIRRDQSGATPFTFDQVDTRNEGQLRAQIGLPGGKFTVASQFRYDLTQSRLFDTEVAVAWRGKAIEPRFFYRTQNSQFGFGVTLPGFLP